MLKSSKLDFGNKSISQPECIVTGSNSFILPTEKNKKQHGKNIDLKEKMV